MQVDDGKMKHDFAKGLSLGHHSLNTRNITKNARPWKINMEPENDGL